MCEVNFWTVSAVEESFDPSLAILVFSLRCRSIQKLYPCLMAECQLSTRTGLFVSRTHC